MTALSQSSSAMDARSRWAIILALTLLLHALLFISRVGWQALPPAAHPKIEFQQINSKQLETIRNQWKHAEKQFLLNKNPAKPDPTVAPPKDARYESDRNSRVEKEQRARKTNVIPKPGVPLPATPAQPLQQPPKSATRPFPNLQRMGIPFRLSANPEQTRPQPKTLAPSIQHQEGNDAGDQYIRDKLPEGSENMLNTRESVYYSFYARIYESIGPIWQSHTREITYRRFLRPGEYSTVVDIVLDANGELQDIRHVQDTGIPELDHAVDTSWHRINRFPNPPRGLLDKQRELHMVWTFTVHIDEGSGVQYLPPERMD